MGNSLLRGSCQLFESEVQSKLESLSPNSRWILYKNTGSGEVEREARQPRARQRHLRRGEPPAPRIMMGNLGLHP